MKQRLDFIWDQAADVNRRNDFSLIVLDLSYFKSPLFSLGPCRYENPLSPLGQHISSDLGLTKRHFFEIPSPHCNLDLDEYEYEDDFE